MKIFNSRREEIKKFSEIKATPGDCIKFTDDGKIEFCRCGTYEVSYYDENGMKTSRKFKVYMEDGTFKTKKIKKSYYKKKPKKLFDPRWMLRKS